MTRCPQCGVENQGAYQFCGSCGTPLAEIATPPEQMSKPAAALSAPRSSSVQPSQTNPIFDNKSQYDRVVAYVIPGETLSAVFDCKGSGTGFVGITDQRLIFYDQGVVLGKKSMISLPYHQIIGVASADEGVIFTTSEITLITAAGKFSFQFRGSEKAHWAYRFIVNQILNQAHPQLRG